MNKFQLPSLRFKSFTESDSYKKTKLDSLLEFKNGINAPKEAYGKGVKFINVLDILSNNFITYDKIINSVDIDDSQFNTYKVTYGDILFQRSSETRDDVGSSNVYLDNEKDCVFGGFVIRGRKIGDYNPYYLKENLQSSYVKNQITSKSGGSTRYNVNQSILESIYTYLPSLEEQTKIATFLSTIDSKITSLERLVSHWQAYKKGIMQQIFTQQLRFKAPNGQEFPKWEKKRINAICRCFSSSLAQNSIELNKTVGYPVYGANCIVGYLNDFQFEESYVSVLKDGAGIGRLFLCQGKSSILGTLQGLQCKENIDINFLFYLLSTINFSKYATGMAIPHIYFKDYSQEQVSVPSIEEQTKIANFLSSLDDKIAHLQQQLTSYRQFKKGLLQQMFV